MLFSIGAAFRARGSRVLYFAGYKLVQDRYKVAEIEHAADCLSEALAGRINRGEDIPPPSRLRRGQHWVAPEPTIALKAALHSALRTRGMTVADLARRLDIEPRKAARLIDPRAASSLSDLDVALSALGYAIAIELHEKPAA